MVAATIRKIHAPNQLAAVFEVSDVYKRQVLDRAQSVVRLLALLVDFDSLLKIIRHMSGCGGLVNNVLGGIDDALC